MSRDVSVPRVVAFALFLALAGATILVPDPTNDWIVGAVAGDDESDHREAVILARGRLGNEALPLVLPLLDSPSERVWSRVVGALAFSGDPEHARLLLERAQVDDLRRKAIMRELQKNTNPVLLPTCLAAIEASPSLRAPLFEPTFAMQREAWRWNARGRIKPLLDATRDALPEEPAP